MESNNPEYFGSEFKRILVSEEEIKGIICRIANEINRDYKDKKLIICGILKGCFIFMSDLIRKIKIPVEITFIKVSSYGSSSVSAGAGNIKITEFLNLEDYKDYDVLIVDDILDSGNTLYFLKKYLEEKGFANINFCTFLDKPERREADVYVKYTGVQIENEFAVGYGLDFDEKYRNLPFVAALDEKVYKSL